MKKHVGDKDEEISGEGLEWVEVDVDEHGYGEIEVESGVVGHATLPRNSKPHRARRIRKIAYACAKAFFVAIATAIGTKIGDWLGGIIAVTLATALAVLLDFEATPHGEHSTDYLKD